MTFSVMLSRETEYGDIPHAASMAFDDVDEAIGYASDWPGRADIVDGESGELLLTLSLVPGDDGMPS